MALQVMSLRPVVSTSQAPSSAKRFVHEWLEPVHRIFAGGFTALAYGKDVRWEKGWV